MEALSDGHGATRGAAGRGKAPSSASSSSPPLLPPPPTPASPITPSPAPAAKAKGAHQAASASGAKGASPTPIAGEGQAIGQLSPPTQGTPTQSSGDVPLLEPSTPSFSQVARSARKRPSAATTSPSAPSSPPPKQTAHYDLRRSKSVGRKAGAQAGATRGSGKDSSGDESHGSKSPQRRQRSRTKERDAAPSSSSVRQSKRPAAGGHLGSPAKSSRTRKGQQRRPPADGRAATTMKRAATNQAATEKAPWRPLPEKHCQSQRRRRLVGRDRGQQQRRHGAGGDDDDADDDDDDDEEPAASATGPATATLQQGAAAATPDEAASPAASQSSAGSAGSRPRRAPRSASDTPRPIDPASARSDAQWLAATHRVHARRHLRRRRLSLPAASRKAVQTGKIGRRQRAAVYRFGNNPLKALPAVVRELINAGSNFQTTDQTPEVVAENRRRAATAFLSCPCRTCIWLTSSRALRVVCSRQASLPRS